MSILLIMAATFVAILDFSNCSRISSWYPADIQSRDTKYVKSSEKKTVSVNAGYSCQAAWLYIKPFIQSHSYQAISHAPIICQLRPVYGRYWRTASSGFMPRVIRRCNTTIWGSGYVLWDYHHTTVLVQYSGDPWTTIIPRGLVPLGHIAWLLFIRRHQRREGRYLITLSRAGPSPCYQVDTSRILQCHKGYSYAKLISVLICINKSTDCCICRRNKIDT